MMVDLKRLVGQSIGLFVAFTLALFIPAGTVGWLSGWLYLALFFGFYLGIEAWLYHHNPGLLQERTHFGTSDQKGWDKLLFPVLLAFPFLWLIFIALDAERFHWSVVPVWVQVVGAVLLALSFYLFFLTFRENSYLSPVVRIQKDRGHSVISTGPYHYVRHPMYAGMVVFSLATPLLLGSWYGILAGAVLIAIVMRRAVLEERTLCSDLDGYEDYMTQVKYRLVPHVW